MRMLDLFSGIGGISLAAEWASIETVAFCEIEPFPQTVLRKQWNNVPIYDDVKALTKERLEADGITAIDIISAGYPCQPFSVAGKREGAADDRHLWPEVKRLLQEIRPRWFVGENVAGHITLGLDDVLSDLEGLSYTAQAFVIPACSVNAPHRRDRVFIVGYTEHYGSSSATFRRSVDSASDHVTKRQGETGESERTSRRESNAVLAYTAERRLQERRQSGLTEGGAEAGTGVEPESERCSSLANSQGERREKTRQHSERSEEWITGSGSNVADTESQRTQRVRTGRFEIMDARYEKRKFESDCNGVGQQRPTQPGLGGMSHGLSAELDENRLNPLDILIGTLSEVQWPAPMGMSQYDWEPPRIATGVKNRVARLKALGNAVVPQQIYPIFQAIVEIERLGREDT